MDWQNQGDSSWKQIKNQTKQNMRLRFDLRSKCEKCGQEVERLAKTKTWHHVNYEDYLKCGFVIPGKKYVINGNRKSTKQNSSPEQRIQSNA